METLPFKHVSLFDLIRVSGRSRIALSRGAERNVLFGEQAVQTILDRGEIAYGVNTGVGDLCDRILSKEELGELQKNIILSHACGSAPYLDEPTSRAALFLVINERSKGFSGSTLKILQKLALFFNKNISPLLPAKGSLGASGDLIPLAHVGLMLMGKGSVFDNGTIRSAAAVFRRLGITTHEFNPKEALSIINGTAVTSAVSAFAIFGARNLLLSGNKATAALFEILGASRVSLDKKIHELKPYPGQQYIARVLRTHVEGSVLCDQKRAKIQDSYVIRCAPQIDGAIWDQIERGREVVETEMNSVTDNPLFFMSQQDTEVLSGGNFHAQEVAFAMDLLGIALSSYSKVVERRTERIVNSSLSGLPSFLVLNGGLNSGFMIPQYLMAALIAENAVLANPASNQSLPVSANQEDFVSMSMTSAYKATQILRNCEQIVAIEFLMSAQAIDILITTQKHKLNEFSRSTRDWYKKIRRLVPVLAKDRWMSADIELISSHIKNGFFV